MLQFIPVLLQWLAPAALTFFTPARCLAVFKAIAATLEFVANNHADEGPEQQHAQAMVFLCAQYDLLDEVANIDEGIDKFVKDTAFPLILSLVYGGSEHA